MLQKFFVLFISAVIIISCIFYLLTHAPCKRNKSAKMEKIRKISTVFYVMSTETALIYVRQPKGVIVTILICFTVIHFSLNSIIRKL